MKKQAYYILLFPSAADIALHKYIMTHIIKLLCKTYLRAFLNNKQTNKLRVGRKKKDLLFCTQQTTWTQGSITHSAHFSSITVFSGSFHLQHTDLRATGYAKLTPQENRIPPLPINEMFHDSSVCLLCV